jgi:hypothetical protein
MILPDLCSILVSLGVQFALDVLSFSRGVLGAIGEDPFILALPWEIYICKLDKNM